MQFYDADVMGMEGMRRLNQDLRAQLAETQGIAAANERLSRNLLHAAKATEQAVYLLEMMQKDRLELRAKIVLQESLLRARDADISMLMEGEVSLARSETLKDVFGCTEPELEKAEQQAVDDISMVAMEGGLCASRAACCVKRGECVAEGTRFCL
jgi:hypothetical protein